MLIYSFVWWQAHDALQAHLGEVTDAAAHAAQAHAAADEAAAAPADAAEAGAAESTAALLERAAQLHPIFIIIIIRLYPLH